MQARGACPGAYTPMASGDGWLVRVRTGARALTSAELRALARLAHAYGNGVIELTRRANLQLRGLRVADVPALRAELIALGLVDASPLREGRAALLVDPLAAVSSGAGLAELALTLDEALIEGAALGMSPKLGVVLDAGSGSVAGVDADIRVVVSGAERVQFFLASHAEPELLGEAASAQARGVIKALLTTLEDFAAVDAGGWARGGDAPIARAAASHGARSVPGSGVTSWAGAAELDDKARGARGGDASAFAGDVRTYQTAHSGDAGSHALHRDEAQRDRKRAAPRVRDLVAARGLAALRAACGALIQPARTSVSSAPPLAALGWHEAGGPSWFGVAVPFGSALHGDWAALAELAERFGAAEVRLTPGREVLILGVRREAADQLAQAALSRGLIVHAHDPRLRIAACSGAPACGSAYGETRGLASRLGAQLEPLLAAGGTLHVSGCEKGCAARGLADVTLVLAPTGARVAWNGDVAAASGAMVVPMEALASVLSERLRASPSTPASASAPTSTLTSRSGAEHVRLGR